MFGLAGGHTFSDLRRGWEKGRTIRLGRAWGRLSIGVYLANQEQGRFLISPALLALSRKIRSAQSRLDGVSQAPFENVNLFEATD